MGVALHALVAFFGAMAFTTVTAAARAQSCDFCSEAPKPFACVCDCSCTSCYSLFPDNPPALSDCLGQISQNLPHCGACWPALPEHTLDITSGPTGAPNPVASGGTVGPSDAQSPSPTGPMPPDVTAAFERAQPLLDQAIRAVRSNDKGEALRLGQQAILQIQRDLGPYHPWRDVIQSRVVAMAQQGRPPRAIPPFPIPRIVPSVQLPQIPGTDPRFLQHLVSGGIDRDFQMLREAGRAAAEGRTDDAVRLFREGLKGKERLFELALISSQTQEGKFTTARAHLAIANMMAEETAAALSLAVANPKHLGAVDLAVGIAATRLQRSQRGERDFSAAVWARELTGDQYRALQGQRSELAWLEYARAAGVEFERNPESRLGQLRKSIRAARRRLGARLERDRQRQDQLDFDSVVPALHRALTRNQRLLMYVRYQPFEIATGDRGPPRYAALVVGSESNQVAIFDLGPASEIERGASAFIAGIQTKIAGRAKIAAKPLYRLLLEKLLASLPDGVELKLALDGPLHLIPFAALHDGQRWLIDRYSFTYLTSAQDLLRRPASTRSSRPILFGGVNYEPYARHLLAGGKRPPPTSPLPGTKAEVEAIQSLLSNAELVTGNAATKQRLGAVRSPSILHVASHATFLWDDAGGGVDALMRSALILTPLGNSDGLMTAYEVEGLDLLGTQLVVLSACDTGLGEFPTHEGVLGFRRSFFVAGAETLVSSLWQVSDAATKELMVNYYGRLVRGEGRVDAMMDAMRELKTRYPYPYLWAPFIVLGNGDPLRR